MQAEETNATQKGVSILNNVFGINTAEYSITSTEKQDSFLGVIPETNVEYTLNSSKSGLKLLCTFTDGSLTILHVLEKQGSPLMIKPTDNLLDTAKGFLTAYQLYSGNSLYGELSSMLEKVSTHKNSTLISNTTKLDVTISELRETFTWSYTYNGVNAASKCISIGFEGGSLKHFIDTWNLYKIGSTTVNISEEEAIKIALEDAKTYKWNVKIENETVEINNFKLNGTAVTQLVFCNSLNADNPHNVDALMLFPMWRIGVSLDKFYPGNVYGICVDVWADTKHIRDIQEVFTTLDPEFLTLSPLYARIATIEESSLEKTSQMTTSEVTISSLLPTIFILFLIAVSSTIGTLIFLNTKGHNYLPKKRSSFKVIALFICFLVLFIPITSSISIADARGCSTIWGSLATPKTQGELDKQDQICQYIDTVFDSNGWLSNDFQGTYSTGSNLLNNIESVEANNPRVATVWFDHGIGENLNLGQGHQNEFHFMLCDSNNDHVYDYQIYDKTDLGRTKFALINTCLSSRTNLINPLTGQPFGSGTYGYNNGIPIGMPYAWTHGAYLDSTGYESPDTTSSYCYIGFPWGSASLDQTVDSDYSSIKYYDWIQAFFNYSLNYDMTVKQALDHASYECFPPQYFDDTDLYNGFIAIWYPLPEFEDCTMTVYGNANIKLYQQPYTITVAGAGDEGNLPAGMQLYPRYDGDTFQLSAQPNQYHVFSYWQCTSGSINIDNIYSNPATFTVQGDATVRAVFADKTQVYITASTADGNCWISPGSGFYATGTDRIFTYGANSGYEITGVMVDGNWQSITGSYTFPAGSMWQDHTITIYSGPMSTLSWSATHIWYGGDLNEYVTVDGGSWYQTPCSFDVTHGEHTFVMSEAFGYYWVEQWSHTHYGGGTDWYYYTNTLSNLHVDDNDSFVVYYQSWHGFMAQMEDLGYDTKYIEEIVDMGVSPKALSSYSKLGFDLYAVGVLLNMGFTVESFQPLEVPQLSI